MKTQKWSERSQSSLLNEVALKERLGTAEQYIEHTKSRIDEQASLKADAIKRVVDGGTHQGQWLDGLTKDIAGLRELLQGYEAERDQLRSQLEKLVPSSVQLATRTQRQNEIAVTVERRIGKTGEIDELLGKLRLALRERAELTQTLEQSAAELEFQGRDMDSLAFENLLSSLPSDLRPQSQRWSNWFLGQEAETKTYFVRDESLVIPETLASHGIYHRGDKVELTDVEASELLRSDRPAPTKDRPWRCAAPSIISQDEYDKLLAEAGQTDTPIEDALDYLSFTHAAAQQAKHELMTAVPDTKIRVHGALVGVPLRA